MVRRKSPPPPPPPSASSAPTAVAGPSMHPTSMSNSANATIMSTAAKIMSRLFTKRSPFKGLPRGESTAGFNMERENKKRALELSPAAVGQGSTSGSPFSEPPPAKCKRGRRPGPAKKQLNALGKGGAGFIPHVLLVNPGEDIVSKIMAFSEQAPRTICVLSGYGAVSNVTLCQPPPSGGRGTISFEGKFELISLSGTYMFAEDHGGGWRRSGVLRVVLGGADGQVVGGAVCGLLVAATQVQVIVGSFQVGEKKMNSNTLKPGSSAAPPQSVNYSDSSDENPSGPLKNLQLSRLWNDERQ